MSRTRTRPVLPWNGRGGAGCPAEKLVEASALGCVRVGACQRASVRAFVWLCCFCLHVFTLLASGEVRNDELFWR